MKQITSLLLFIALATTAGAQSNGYFNKVKAKQLEAHPSTGQLVIINDTDSEIFMNSNSSDSSLLPWMYHRLDSADLDAGTIDGTVIGGTTPAAGSFSTIDADGGTIDGTVIGGTVAASGSFSTTNIDGGTMDNTVIGSTTPAAGSFSTVDVDGGTIDGTVIGGTTPAAADFTNVTATAFNGVALSDGGSSTSFLNEEGNYITVAGAVSFGDENQIPTVNSSTDGYDYTGNFTYEAEAYDLTVLGFTHSLDVSGQDGTIRGVSINNDGTELFLAGSENDFIYRYTLSTAYDISTASYIHALDLSGLSDDFPNGISINNDGTELFLSGADNRNIYRYTLSTPYDLTTASYIHALDVSAQTITPFGASINNDGTELFVAGHSNEIYRYTLSTPYDLTTATFTHSLDISTEETSSIGVSINNDGTELFVVGDDNKRIYRYTLSSPYDLTTATFTSSVSVASQDGSPRGVSISSDGVNIYLSGDSNDAIYQYNMTRLYANSISINSSINSPNDLVLATEGAQALSVDDDQVVTIGANDLGTDHLHADDKLVISDGDDSGISILSTDEGTYGAYVSLKEIDGTTFTDQFSIVRLASSASMLIKYGSDEDPTANPTYLRLYGTGELQLPNYSGTGTQDAQFTSSGQFTRITSDESTKKIYGPLRKGLRHVVNTAKATIEFDYLDEEMNAEAFHHWGFGARAATKEAGKNPAFREYEGVMQWDSKQMIAPLYNAVSELNDQNERFRSWISGLCLFLVLQTMAFFFVGRKFIKQNN